MAKRTRTGDLSHLSVEALEEGISRRSCHVKPAAPKVSTTCKRPVNSSGCTR